MGPVKKMPTIWHKPDDTIPSFFHNWYIVGTQYLCIHYTTFGGYLLYYNLLSYMQKVTHFPLYFQLSGVCVFTLDMDLNSKQRGLGLRGLIEIFTQVEFHLLFQRYTCTFLLTYLPYSEIRVLYVMCIKAAAGRLSFPIPHQNIVSPPSRQYEV